MVDKEGLVTARKQREIKEKIVIKEVIDIWRRGKGCSGASSILTARRREGLGAPSNSTTLACSRDAVTLEAISPWKSSMLGLTSSRANSNFTTLSCTSTRAVFDYVGCLLCWDEQPLVLIATLLLPRARSSVRNGQSVRPGAGRGRMTVRHPVPSFCQHARQVRMKDEDGRHFVVPSRLFQNMPNRFPPKTITPGRPPHNVSPYRI